jgi:hypothetical protein
MSEWELPDEPLEKRLHVTRCEACGDSMLGATRHYCYALRCRLRTRETCGNGHPQNDENIRIVHSTGKRVCRPCEKLAGDAYRARKRGKAA